MKLAILKSENTNFELNAKCNIIGRSQKCHIFLNV